MQNYEKKQTRVLVIEDEELPRESICNFLELAGFTTFRASNGREGVEMFGRHEPDLVITDIKMPQMSGHDILKFIKAYSTDTPVIVISGTDSLSDVVECLKLGAWDYIIKPVYDYAVVEISIQRALEKKQLIEENKRYREYLEEEVIKRSDELLTYTVRFKTLFNLAGDALFIFDEAGVIVDCNEAAKNLGYERAQLLTMNIRDLILPDDIAIFDKISGRLPRENNLIFESRFKCHNNSIAIMELHATMVDSGPSRLVLAICRDITERRKIERERSMLQKQISAAQKMELVGLLTSGISHDFNNVLSALVGYAELLQANLKSVGADKLSIEFTDKIFEIANKGISLTGRLMSFIRKKREELAPVDIHKALADAELMLRPNCKGIKILHELCATEFIILGDESQIQNAFLNLGLNARDAMPNGGTLTFKTSNVSSYKDSAGKFIQIDVIDNGCGISEENINNIFEPLFTTKAKGEGTGLGLPGVLYGIKNLHGHIDVESEVGKGTTFKITLPLYEPTQRL